MEVPRPSGASWRSYHSIDSDYPTQENHQPEASANGNQNLDKSQQETQRGIQRDIPETVHNHEQVLATVCSQCGSLDGPFLCPKCLTPRTIPPPSLTSWDVGALILNKMIGTGIFTTPPLVLLYTGSGSVALGLWIVGFFYTILSMFIYLQFARELPHTGGELIYLNEIFRHPKLLVYTLYALFFVLVWNDATNSMQFALHVFISATWTGEGCPATIDPRFLRFLAVVLVSFVCLLHYFSARIARATNMSLAVIKTAIVLALFAVGCRTVRENPRPGANYRHIDTTITFTSNCTTIPQRASTSSPASSGAAAFLLVLFSFQGWENATFVADEIPTYKTLKRGFIGAVMLVGILYIMINAVFLAAVSYADVYKYVIEGGSNIGPWFGHNSVEANKIWAILLAISAAGNLVSVIYTEARVKQGIAKVCLLPWSSYWARGAFSPETPQGGLILHWISSVTFIIISSRIKNTGEAISFPGLLQTYGQAFIGLWIGYGFLLLARRVRTRKIHAPSQPHWAGGSGSTLSKSKITRGIAAFLYLVVNLYIVVVTIIPPYRNADGTTRSVKGWIYIVAMGGITIFTLVYYILVVPTSRKQWSIINWTGATARVEENENGSHHATYGYRQFISIRFPEDEMDARTRPAIKSFWYWFFGGTNVDHHPRNFGDGFEKLTSKVRGGTAERVLNGNAPGSPTN